MEEKKTNLVSFLLFSFIFFIFDRLLKKILFLKEEFLFFKLIRNYYFALFFKEKIFYFFIFFLLILIVFLMVFYYQRKNFSHFLFLSFILIGGISNLLDRLFYGFVIDYFIFFNFFTFNLADLMIFLGGLFFLINLL
jgi:signal peptidase II